MKFKNIGIVFILYLLAMIVMTVIPNVSLHQKIGIGIFKFRLDYWLHLMTYFGAACIFILWQYNNLINQPLQNLFKSIVIFLMFALSTEFIQLIVPERSFNIKDFIANSIGIISAYSLFLIFRFFNKKELLPLWIKE